MNTVYRRGDGVLRNYYDMLIRLNTRKDNKERINEVEKIIERASLLELRGIMLLVPFTSSKEVLEYKEHIEKQGKKNDIEIYLSVLLSPSSLTPNTLADFRKQGIITAVEAVDIREAAHKGVDIILPSNLPLLLKQFNQVLSSLLSSSLISILLPLHDFLSLPRHKQILSLNALRLVYKLNEKYFFPLIVGSGATKPNEMRSGRDLASFSYIINPNLEQALSTTSTYPEVLIKKIKTLSNPVRKQPGVYEIDKIDKIKNNKAEG